jgi:putative flippase GtrA
MTRQLLRFGLVGVAGYVVDSGALYAAMAVGLGTGGGRVVSFLSAVLATWLLNRQFTFKQSTGASGGYALLLEWLRYVAAMSVGGALNLASYAWIMASFNYYPALPALAVGVGSLVGMMANFAGAKFWVYRQRKR